MIDACLGHQDEPKAHGPDPDTSIYFYRAFFFFFQKFCYVKVDLLEVFMLLKHLE